MESGGEMNCVECGFPIMLGKGKYHAGCTPTLFDAAPRPSIAEAVEAAADALIDAGCTFPNDAAARSALVDAVFPEKPPHNKTATSKAAAKAIKPDSARLRDLIHGFLVSRGTVGATDQEMQEHFKLDGNTQRPRRYELVKAGRVKDSGRTRKPIGSRNQQIIWVAKGGKR